MGNAAGAVIALNTGQPKTTGFDPELRFANDSFRAGRCVSRLRTRATNFSRTSL